MADIIQTHRMTNLVSTSNPFLADGELIYNEVSKDMRIGDAVTAYNSLARLDMLGGVLPYKSILTFDADEVVVYSGVLYSSLQGSNTGNQPDTSPLYWEAVGGGSGETFAMNWGYDVTTTAADPGAGIFRLNNATIASSTVMYINDTDADGIDASELIEALTANDFQFLENVADSTEGMLIKIVSVVDNTGWYTVTYTVEGQASAATWTDEGDFGVLFMFRGGSGGGHVIQDDGTPLTQRTNLDFIGFDVSDDAGNDATVVQLPAAAQVQTAMTLIDSVDITTALTSHTFSGLDGDIDTTYQIRGYIKRNGGSTVNASMEINADSTAANYYRQRLYSSGSSVNSDASTPPSGVDLGGTSASNRSTFDILLHAKSGKARDYNSTTGHTVTDTSVSFGVYAVGLWKNTVDNITSLVFAVNGGSTMEGSHIELWAEREVGGGSISEETTHTFDGTTNSVTFDVSGFTKDSLEVEGLMRSAGAAGSLMMRFNTDTGNNYDSVYYNVSDAGVIGQSGIDGLAKSALRLGNFNTTAAAAGTFAPVNIKIPLYLGTSINKGYTCQFAYQDGSGAYGGSIGGTWRSNAAVTSVTIYEFAGNNFANGSTLKIKGI